MKKQPHLISWLNEVSVSHVTKWSTNWRINNPDHVKWHLVRKKGGDLHNAYHHLGQPEDWIYFVSLSTCTCYVLSNILSHICQSTLCHFKHWLRHLLLPRQFKRSLSQRLIQTLQLCDQALEPTWTSVPQHVDMRGRSEAHGSNTLTGVSSFLDLCGKKQQEHDKHINFNFSLDKIPALKISEENEKNKTSLIFKNNYY